MMRGRKRKNEISIRKCKIHGEAEFSANKPKDVSKRTKWRCLKCASVRIAKQQKTYKQRILDILGNKCQICGYDTYSGALEFHHIDAQTKSFALSLSSLTKGWVRILKELKKCTLLCANCHREVHAGVLLLPDKTRTE